MDFIPHLSIKKVYFPFSLIALVSCGGGSSGGDSNTTEPIDNTVSTPHYFRDEDASNGKIGGYLNLARTNNSDDKINSVRLYWADALAEKNGEAWLDAAATNDFKVIIPNNTIVPDNVDSFLIYPVNNINEEGNANIIKFHDFIGNVQVSGPGGIGDSYNNSADDHPNADDGVTREGAWYYGGLSVNDRPKISMYRSDIGGGTCVFDNGLVAVTDMANEVDPNWKARSGAGLSNIVNDVDFPPFSFLCDESNPINTSFEVPRVKDEYGPWTYSPLNDAMFYGAQVYDTFLKYLGEPPLAEKIRLRVHYGAQNNLTSVVYWDGAYANFNGVMDSTKMTTLGLIAHEVGHGVLSRISNLDIYQYDLSDDARTVHEAFGDLSGVMAKYDFTGKLNWIHDNESKSTVRRLNQIVTHTGAISSFLDYSDAGSNYYLRIGMITYPFYLGEECNLSVILLISVLT